MEKLYFHIETLFNQGCGVARRDDKKFIIPFTLPGEEVEAEPVATKKNMVFCRLVRILRSSPKRIQPKCRYFGQCGGCDLQHLAYEDQLVYKQRWIEDLVGPFLHSHNLNTSTFTPRNASKAGPPLADFTGRAHFNTIIPSPKQFNYRNRITLHSNGRLVGYYKPFSHEIVPIERCEIASEVVNETLSTTSSRAHELTNSRKNKHNQQGHAVIEIPGLQQSFTQVNSSQNKNLIQTVLNFCSGKKWTSALELYCGSGNLTFDLANTCKKIVAVDLDAEAIRLANTQRHELKRSNIKFIVSSAHDVVFQYVQDLQRFDLIICDPPREGLKETAALLPRFKPKQIVYVSCNPQTFVNDVRILERFGYSLTHVVPIDMFPQTYHVEVVGRMDFQPKTS